MPAFGGTKLDRNQQPKEIIRKISLIESWVTVKLFTAYRIIRTKQLKCLQWKDF